MFRVLIIELIKKNLILVKDKDEELYYLKKMEAHLEIIWVMCIVF